MVEVIALSLVILLGIIILRQDKALKDIQTQITYIRLGKKPPQWTEQFLFDDEITEAQVGNQPDYGEMLTTPEKVPSDKHARKLYDFIRRNEDTDITLKDMRNGAGVPANKIKVAKEYLIRNKYIKPIKTKGKKLVKRYKVVQ